MDKKTRIGVMVIIGICLALIVWLWLWYGRQINTLDKKIEPSHAMNMPFKWGQLPVLTV
jgi:hypothetical protein